MQRLFTFFLNLLILDRGRLNCFTFLTNGYSFFRLVGVFTGVARFMSLTVRVMW